MGKQIQLTASDGHKFAAYVAEPQGKPRGAIVVIQEIFGVNAHMRETTDGFAKDGYMAISPALFDRAKTDVELGYGEADIAAGRDIRMKCEWDKVMLDMAATVEWGKAHGKVGSVGYCWGGSVSYLCGTRLPVTGSVVYYGGQIVPFVDEKLKSPSLMHFGELDKGIPLADVDTIKKKHPEADVIVYKGADHGFNCDHRKSYEPASAKLARSRTLEFFRKHVG